MTLALTLIHGWGSSPRVWDRLREHLPAAREVRTAALPGHGGGRLERASLDAWAEVLLDALPQSTALCGWSLGALVAMQLALRAPARFGRLILIGASPCFVRRADWPCALGAEEVDEFMRAFDAEPASLQKRFRALQSLGDARRREVLQALADAGAPLAGPTHRTMAAGLQILRDSDLRPQLARLAQPVRLLHGACDALMPAEAAVALADLLPDGRLSVFDDCAHAPQLSRPRDCAALIESFLSD